LTSTSTASGTSDTAAIGAERHARLLDLQAAAAQEAAQLLPHQRIGQHVAQMQHQVAAVRLQQAAGADARKIGHQHVVLGLVFDAAEQRAEQRVVLDDHRRAGRGRRCRPPG
jgi:hypothetical protein